LPETLLNKTANNDPMSRLAGWVGGVAGTSGKKDSLSRKCPLFFLGGQGKHGGRGGRKKKEKRHLVVGEKKMYQVLEKMQRRKKSHPEG